MKIKIEDNKTVIILMTWSCLVIMSQKKKNLGIKKKQIYLGHRTLALGKGEAITRFEQCGSEKTE